MQSGRRTLALAGDLNMATAPKLDDAIGRLWTSTPRELLLDLRRLSFVDSTGLRALLAANKACSDHGCRLLLTHAIPAIERVFAVTGISEQLAFLPET